MLQPNQLKQGDTVGLLALACKVDFELLTPAIQILEKEWGLKVELGNSLTAVYHQFAGDDNTRADDFQRMIDTPEIKAIFSVRGGYGSSRIIDMIDFTSLKTDPKWIVGFSDITAVHCHLQKQELESIHGVMPKLFAQDGGEESLESLRNLLFGGRLKYQVPPSDMNRLGEGKGTVIGGNLALLTHLIGSNSDLDFSNKILFLEDVGEYLYNIDRMMIQLKRAKKLDNLSGLIIGHFSECKDNETPFGKTPQEIIQEAVAEYNFPVCYDFPVGHEAENWAIPCGREVHLCVGKEKVVLEEGYIMNE
jgi:muramoyltetrapeptide carboxypeptidase